MNLNDDESLKQEVIYLHSLWHQGPPTRNPIPSPNFNPIQRSRQSNYIPPAELQLLSRYGAVTPQVISRNPYLPQDLYNNKRQRPDLGREWPVNELPRSSATRSGWPDFQMCKKPKPAPVEDKANFAVNKLQRDIHRTCRQFFGKKSDEEDSSVAGGDGDGSGSDEGDEEQSSEKEGSSSKEFQFLSKLFEEEVELKEYYKKKNANGDFWCLVCGGTGDKSVRKFKSGLALVQHSLNKKDMKPQHRALAEVICNVLGWDVNNPVISSQKATQTVVEDAVVECASEPPSELSDPHEKQQVIKSVDDPAKTAVLQMQQNASEALKDISAKEGTDSVDEVEEENGDENLSEEFELITRVFSENVELKSYYEENYEGGNFVCLICYAATDKRMIKRFRHCHGLVRHCTKEPKVKKQAHKAYARFLCELFGWDFDQLPSRVMKVESNASQKIEKPPYVIEDHMCEDEAKNAENGNEACVS